MAEINAYLGIGSNIDPQHHIRLALSSIRRDFERVKISNLYRSAAVGFSGEDFLNAVARITTDKALDQLIDYANQLEQAAGRVRIARGRFDSRTLDVDVLMYGDLQGEHHGKTLPSEDIHTTAHVLLPLSEIAGDLRHPVLGKKFSKLWKSFRRDNDLEPLQLQRIEL